MRGALFGLALSFVIGAFACLAIKPLRVDGGSTPAPEPDADPTCVACLKAGDEPGPGCKTEYDACQAAAECAQSFTCALADGCFASASLAALGACGLPCVYDSGIASFNDPAFKTAVALFRCLSGPCAVACHVGDAQ
jgi:hypothetical protein